MVQYKRQFYKELGNNIKNARDVAGITQERLAQEIGSNRTTIINIERGQQVPVHMLLSIASVLSMPHLDLLPQTTRLEDRPDEQRDWIKAGLQAALGGL